jgi:hypothetical protein
MEHPTVRQAERTGYPIPIRHPEVFTVDPITCDCGCRAKLTVGGKGYCASCADDERGIVLL